MKRFLFLGSLIVLFALGCSSSENSSGNNGNNNQQDVVQDSSNTSDTSGQQDVNEDKKAGTDSVGNTDTSGKEDTAKTDKGNSTEQKKVGEPCEVDQDCTTGFCLTTEVLQSLLKVQDVEVPDGYCSKMLCSSNTECGDNAKCIDLQPYGLSGTACLADCDPDQKDSCRDGYTCFADSKLKDASGSAVEKGVCLPDSVVNTLPSAEGSQSE